ncbi:MAG TPA: rhodanese-like domain-containing protein, partial [Methanocella sp.]|nr:rhodanese-like domain-containing protein [Methanocella sp.]
MYEQKVRTLSMNELLDMYKNNVRFVLADARSREDYDESHLPGARSMPLEDIKDIAGRLDKNEEIVTYCGGFQCPASTEAAKELMRRGFKNVLDFKGGIQEWTEKGYPTE